MTKRTVTRIFISRRLSDHSPFRMALKGLDVHITDRSLIDMQALPASSLPCSHWLFFYSQNAIRFFADQYEHDRGWHDRSIGCFGMATANFFREYVGRPVDYIGQGNAQATAPDFARHIGDEIVTFIGAVHSMDSVRRALSNSERHPFMAVYENRAKTRFRLPHCDFLVFTSPLNVRAYMARYALTSQQEVLAIGPTTTTALLEKGAQNVHTADHPSESALAEIVKARLSASSED